MIIKNIIAKKIYNLLLALLLLLGVAACNKNESNGSSGTLKMSLTDAPVDDSNIKAVWITVREINMKSNGGWETMENFTLPKKFNLMDLRDSNAVFLGEESLPAGSYNEIRFVLDAPEDNGSTQSNPGSYIEYKDGTTQPLFVPSGAQSGFKAKGSFDVPVNGTVDITSDFDAHKSIVMAGSSGKFLLKPVIRIVVNNQAGTISGNVSNAPSSGNLVIYTYEDGVYTNSEDDEPAAGDARFPNAVSSALVNTSDNSYILPYLAAGTYDLVVVSNNPDGSFGSVLGFVPNVIVQSEATTSVNIDINNLSPTP
jgi:hypothetical protein